MNDDQRLLDAFNPTMEADEIRWNDWEDSFYETNGRLPTRLEAWQAAYRQGALSVLQATSTCGVTSSLSRNDPQEFRERARVHIREKALSLLAEAIFKSSAFKESETTDEYCEHYRFTISVFDPDKIASGK